MSKCTHLLNRAIDLSRRRALVEPAGAGKDHGLPLRRAADARSVRALLCDGCWRYNVFVERLWMSVKYEEVYLHAYDSVSEAKKGLERYWLLYNQRRPHTVLNGN